MPPQRTFFARLAADPMHFVTVHTTGEWTPEKARRLGVQFESEFGKAISDVPDGWPKPTRPSPSTDIKRGPSAPWHPLCWLLGHAPYSDRVGSTHCARCLRRLP